jgi:hypothetical protein
MVQTYEVRSYKPNDQNEIVNLLIQTFPEWQKRKNPIDYWTWKYIDTPYGSDIRIIEKAGKIIFVGHQMQEYIKIADKILLATYGDDFATHQDYRGQGLWSSTRVYSEKMIKRLNIKFSFSLSSNPVVIESNKKRMNRGFPKPIGHLIKISDIDLHIKAKGIDKPSLMKLGYIIQNEIRKLTIPTLKTLEEEIVIKETKKFGANNDTFWDKIKPDYDFIIDKSSHFLNWRFCDPRGGNFRIYQAIKNDQILGFIVTNIVEEAGYKEGYIMELLTLDDQQNIADKLIQHALKTFEDDYVNAVHYKECVSGKYQNAFKRNSFIEIPGMQEIYIPCSFKADKHLEPIFRNAPSTRLHFGYGDYY